jgi:ribosome-binding factor A
MTPIPQQVPPQQNPEDETPDSDNDDNRGPPAGLADVQRQLTDYNDIDVVATLAELKTAQAFISALQDASLDHDDGLDAEAKFRLRNPITELINLDDNPDLRAGIDIFFDTTNASDETFKDVRISVNSYLQRLGIDPENHSLPTLYSVKKQIGDLTGVHSIMTHMCPKTCIAYSGPFSALDHCPECNLPRYDPQKLEASNGVNKVPQRCFHTIPLGPQIQALWRNPEGAQAM